MFGKIADPASITQGATVGGSAKARDQAYRDAIEFLKTALAPMPGQQ